MYNALSGWFSHSCTTNPIALIIASGLILFISVLYLYLMNDNCYSINPKICKSILSLNLRNSESSILEISLLQSLPSKIE